ncbi:MAG: 4Fe-4S dicluster domain-containing protein [Gemmatimonadetes bacterium]|nr:4Fe-4S dicluster domain-containing protein [Gemmatimonadota bacterium]
MTEGMERREFLKVLGVAGAGASLLGCSTEGAERLLPYVVPAEEIVPGVATWYRTTCRECPAGCGMDIRTREGRAVKAEGSSLSPISHGRLCPRGQASLHGLYNPDRVPQALARGGAGGWEKLGWAEAEQRLAAALAEARGRKVFLTHTFTGSLDRLLDEWCAALGVERVRFDTFAREPLRAANRLLFGLDVVPVHDFAAAEVVVTFGADFLETWLSPVDYAHSFVRGHAYSEGRRGRLISVTPHRSLTDLNADEWLPVRPGTEHLVALAMARAIVEERRGEAGGAAAFLQGIDLERAAEQAEIEPVRLRELAREFANGGRSLAVGPGVASSHGAATTVAAAVALLNWVAGNVGRTLTFSRAEAGGGAGSYQELQQLFSSLDAGAVGALLVYGPNPVYSVPGGAELGAALEQVPFVASFSSMLDETSRHAKLLLPDHHFLESWGDYTPRTGIHSLIQPVMTPVFATKQAGDVLLSVARRAGAALPTAANSYYDYLRERWREDIYLRARAAAPFEEWWREVQTKGVVVLDVAEPAVRLDAAGLSRLRLELPEFDGGERAQHYLVVYPSHRFYDGRLADRPWLQELPDPVSKISWGSWVEVHPQTAERLGLEDGSVVELETPHGRAQLPAWLYPGTRPDVVAVQLGQGHEGVSRYADGIGVNAARLLAPRVEAASGGLVWFQTRAALRATGEWQKLASTGGSKTQAGREVLHTTTLEEARAVGARGAAAAAAAAQAAHGQRAPAKAGGQGERRPHPQEVVVEQLQGVGGFGPLVVGGAPADYPPPDTDYGEYAQDVPRWGMAIDLDRCIGCSACMTACAAENNIAMVGPKLISRGRIITWIRIERYFPEDAGAGRGADFLPMLCQHCGNAPCEPVCPVYAAYHTPDGLNAQIYNRCVGTRYCANNCPYKVRYFNFFSAEWPTPLDWQLNPDVAVREKGVMEKCTFCVQRIRGREQQARLEGRSVGDGEIVPACAQTCPGEAIVFGNVKDPASRVARLAASGRGYRVLEELNTQSAIVYLKKVMTG